MRTTRCNRETAITNDGSGHPHGGRGTHIRVPGNLCIEMGVRVDDAWHQSQALGIYGFRGLGLYEVFYRHDAALMYRHIFNLGLTQTAIKDQSLANQQVNSMG